MNFKQGTLRSLRAIFKGKSAQFKFIIHGLRSFERILPHIESGEWESAKIDTESELESSGGWVNVNGQQKRAIQVKIFVPRKKGGYLRLTTKFKRKSGDSQSGDVSVLDEAEKNICNQIAKSISKILTLLKSPVDSTSQESEPRESEIVELKSSDETTQSAHFDSLIYQMTKAFDDIVIFEHLAQTHDLEYDLGSLLDFFRDLAEQSYENKALSFGVIFDKSSKHALKPNDKIFPADFVEDIGGKKFRAFTDGYKSAFLLDSYGRVEGMLDLEKAAQKRVRAPHYFPEWCRNIALTSLGKKIGFSLTRQGDILVFERGSLRFTRRFGRWQYWNHAYIINFLKNIARAQRVDQGILTQVVSRLYKYSLDISFRHSGGLFVILKNRQGHRDILRSGDALTDKRVSPVKAQFDKFLKGKTIVNIDRNVILELASIDGAVVFANHGYLIAYGAILAPKRRSRINTAEGSRSKAAIGASYFGVAIKISSDGDISIYKNGKKIMQI